MQQMRVNLNENSYNISFHADFDELINIMHDIDAPNKLLVVTDSNVLGLYADEVVGILKNGGYDVVCYAFAAGEENKEMQSVLGICHACMEHKMDRKSMIVALGGGVTGDMAGFAAAIYMRGIRFIQIPTTLLSQSDSSVGGKTGVDFGGAKNIIGAFFQPKHVYMNVSVLRTLPKREFISGMGEVIKHGIIRDSEFFCYLRDNSRDIKSLRAETLIDMCRTNCKIKAGVVETDERESGVRAHLNFGHTIGHAIESAFDYTKTHGECVGLGMIAASYISEQRGMISGDELEEIIDILDRYGFDTRTSLPDYDKILKIMQSDKKSVDGRLKFVLPTQIGSVCITNDVTENEIHAALDFISN